MGMVVKNNMSAVRTLNTLNSNTSALQKSLQKVSSGMKINSAQDDASGYAISERMRVRIRSLDQANQNSQNDSSLMKTAEGAVGNTVEILRALKEKAINAANDSNTDEDRQTIQKEINQFIDQIDDNALVQFNGKYLVDGSKNNAFFETKSILLNQSLKTGTTSTSALTELANRAGDSLSIQTSDQYQVSWVQNGTIHFTSGRVGTNAISDILTIKNDDDEIISEVSATTKKGLIAAAKDLTETVDKYIPSMTYKSTDQTSFSDVVTAWKTQLGADPSTGASIKLDDILDQTNSQPLFAADSDGTPFDTATITYDGTNYSISLTDGDTIYVQNPKYDFSATPTTNTTDKAIATNITIANDGAATPTDPTSYTTDLAKELIASTKLDGYDAFTETSTGEYTREVTMKLSELLATDSSGNEIADTPKYYLDAAGTDDLSDIIVTRTLKYEKTSSGGNITEDKIAFSVDSSSSRTAVPTDKLYEYNPDYVAPEGEDGLTDAWDKFGKAVYTPDKTEGIAFGAANANVDNQISGLTISILDQDGNVKKAANAALDQFKQYQRAENQTGDMSLNFHIGSEANVSFKVGMGDMRAQALGLKGSDGTRIDVFTKEHANAAINVIENALTKALDQQTTIGAIEARLEYTSTNLTTSSENVQAAESTIRDADMAKEMTNYTKSNVLLQAAQAMLAQANQNSSAVLSLLQ